MQIERIDIEQVKAAAYNPRKDLKAGDPEFEQLRRSIAVFDTVEPLVWNKRTGNLVGGHQRLKVLRERGDTAVDVSVVDLDDAHEKALNIALNKISGEWDMPRLKDLLTNLKDDGFDLNLTGFAELELEELIDFEGKEGKTDDDEAPARPANPRSRRGDIWQCGSHRVMCGDATDALDVNALMGQEKADLVFTDPPYNVDYEGYTKDNLKIQNDKMTPAEFVSFLEMVFAAYQWSLKRGGSLYVCHPSSYQREFQTALEKAGFTVRTQIIWAKNTFAWGHARYKFQHEPIFYAYVSGETDPWYGDKKQSTLWHERKPAANRLHPTMKPVELVLRALKNSSKSGDLVLDLFGGSGTTLIAGEKLNRRVFSMELDPGYCDVIVKRWEDFMGLKAMLLTNSKVEENALVPAR
jgi:DNA modification methylase